jgi:hypothetical protein
MAKNTSPAGDFREKINAFAKFALDDIDRVLYY